MFPVRLVCLLLALVCLCSMGITAFAAEVDCDATYCFTAQDFSQAEDTLVGICITDLPDPDTGTMLLKQRVLQPGDILTAEQLAQMTFAPLRSEEDAQAQVTYLPIYSDRVEKSATAVISIRGKEDKAPAAQDSSVETYKNLPNTGTLQVSDPEGQALTYTLVRKPKRGEVVIAQDGSFTYTPKKNKVGVDSFTFTAADPAGNVSREATVTVQILKPTDNRRYTDTVGMDCRFAAEWLRNTGLFVGEKINGQDCFYPELPVSRGQFLAMVVDALDIPAGDTESAAIPSDTPDWLKPYLAAALRSGLISNWPETESGSFEENKTITHEEAAVMLQNALELPVSQEIWEAQQTASTDEDAASWAAASMAVLQENGICLTGGETLNRGQAAQVLYELSRLSVDAPGTAVFRLQ
ncbi:MAG: cadherin-like domain-containing protein [Oscillospiraceae bacterium]|nr:cadherin-like domain-containing protein [Oscillospiraceae bacterium]